MVSSEAAYLPMLGRFRQAELSAAAILSNLQVSFPGMRVLPHKDTDVHFGVTHYAFPSPSHAA